MTGWETMRTKREPERLLVLEEAGLRLSHHVLYLNSDLNGIYHRLRGGAGLCRLQRRHLNLHESLRWALKQNKV